MEVAIVASLLAKRDVEVEAGHGAKLTAETQRRGDFCHFGRIFSASLR
jgi:hypothetical protein